MYSPSKAAADSQDMLGAEAGTQRPDYVFFTTQRSYLLGSMHEDDVLAESTWEKANT